MSGLTIFEDAAIYHVTPSAEKAEFEGARDEHGSPNAILVGMVILLVILWAVRENSAALQREVLGLNLFNVVTIGISAVLFIWVGKIAFLRFKVPGITPIFAGI